MKTRRAMFYIVEIVIWENRQVIPFLVHLPDNRLIVEFEIAWDKAFSFEHLSCYKRQLREKFRGARLPLKQ